MRIRALYPLFILFLVTVLAANPTTLIKGSVYAAKVDGDIIYMFESEGKSKILDPGDEIQVKELIEFKNIRDNCSLHLFLSNNTDIFVHKKGWFTIENFEHFVDKDETGKSIGGGEIVNMYVRGKVDFRQATIKEEGYISVNTGTADLEIKSKNFYVDSSTYETIVECYDGKIIMTNSIDLKATILEAGNYATVFSSAGEKNTSIKLYPLDPARVKAREDRINNSPPVLWKFSSRPVGTKP